ncbi:hypothetical protein ON010_g16539 [Phytophthora cinnamomi]|nr:hypothetical protein ON010_g16539 [Phytophthora cinnamomi]
MVILFDAPERLWVNIADASNEYQRWQRNFSPEQLAQWNRRMRARNNAFKPKSPAQRRREMAKFKEIQPYELVNFTGLLCGRALCPHRGKLSRHWAADAHGAVPKGTFVKYIARHRFEEIVRYLHFSSNDDPDARQVKTWKIKPVDDAINDSSSRGMTQRVTAIERKFIKAANKVVAETCCSQRTQYYAFYRGNGIDLSLQTAFTQVFSSPRCFLTVGSSTMGPFARIAWSSARVLSTKRKSPDAPRGSYRIAQLRVFSNMVAVTWMDNKPVYFLARGCSTALTTLKRRDGARVEQIPAPPPLVQDYNEGMGGGADTHDQKRLQRFSIQRAMRFNNGIIYLGQRSRQHDPTGPVNTATCSQIWHEMWRNGSDTPEGVRYRRRAPQNEDTAANSNSEDSEEAGPQ